MAAMSLAAKPIAFAEPVPTLSVKDAVGMIVGIVVGAGIFRTPSLVAANVTSETSALLLWVDAHYGNPDRLGSSPGVRFWRLRVTVTTPRTVLSINLCRASRYILNQFEHRSEEHTSELQSRENL